MCLIKPLLYSFRRCPYAMRARMALVYAQVDFELRDILLKDKPDSMLVYSPKGTVPVLVLPDQVIDESLDVMLWALKQNDENSWLNAQNQLELIELCDNEFKAQLDKYKYAARFEKSEEVYRNKAIWFLELLEKQLSEGRYLFSNNVSLADIAIFPFIRQFAFVDKAWFDSLPFIKLQSWLARHLNSYMFTKIMKKVNTWSDAC